MDQTFGNAQSQNPGANEPGGFSGTTADQRSSMASSVERAVDTGAAKVHGAVDVSKDALHAGVRKADDAMIDVRNKTETAMNDLQQKASDVATRVARNPQVEEMTRNLEQHAREHPIRTLAIAVGLGILVGRSVR